MPTLEFSKAISLISRSSTDNEKLAALLIVAKNLPADEIKKEELSTLMDTIGFGFFERVVRSAIKTESYVAFTQVLGSILLQDKRLVDHIAKLNLMRFFNENISSKESLECLETISIADSSNIDKAKFAEALKTEHDKTHDHLDLFNRILVQLKLSEEILSALEVAEVTILNKVRLVENVDTENYEERVIKMIMPALKESQQHNSDVRGQVLATLAKLANTVGLAKISTFIEQNDLELLLRLTMIELQHSLMTYKSTEKMTENESNSAIYNYFIVLEQYLSVFGDESLQAHQVLLSRMCAEMMERIEKQLTELVAVLSGVQHFSDVPLIIHATTQFLAEWLQCEARAVLSYGLAENLLGLARLARQNEELNLMEHLLSGFYKATDSEKGGETYFSEKVGLAEFCFETLRNMSEPRPKALELCNEIITEYFVSLLASDGQIKRMWIAYPAVTQKHNACPSSYAAAVLKLYTIERKSFNMSVMKKIVDYLKGAYVDGKLQKNYEDIDSVRAGIPEVDIRWIRAMSYLVEVVNSFQELKSQIRESRWIPEIVCYLNKSMLGDAENQRVIAVFSNLLSAVQGNPQLALQ